MFTKDSRLTDIAKEPSLKKYLPYFVFNNPFLQESGEKLLRELWNEDAATAVANALARIVHNEETRNRLYPVYPAGTFEKEHVCVVDFPAETEDSGKPWILLCAGGAYQNVWNLTESWPTAVFFNRLGYRVFTLTYTVGRKKLMPEPLRDTATAVAWLQEHADCFGIRPEHYVIGGFSAGGHLAGAWSAEEYGYAKYGALKPSAALLIYPATSCELVSPELYESYYSNIAGTDATPEDIAYWSLENTVTADYPPTYIIHSEDDSLVRVETAKSLEKRLSQLKVPLCARYVKKSGHGFADGAGTDAVDWPLQADCFLRKAVK